MSDSLWPRGLQHTRLPCPLPSPGVCTNSCPLNRWCHPTVSSSAVPFSPCLQSLPASGAFVVNHWMPVEPCFTLLVSIMPPVSFSGTLDPGIGHILSENQCVHVRRNERRFLPCRVHGSVLFGHRSLFTSHVSLFFLQPPRSPGRSCLPPCSSSSWSWGAYGCTDGINAELEKTMVWWS